MKLAGGSYQSRACSSLSHPFQIFCLNIGTKDMTTTTTTATTATTTTYLENKRTPIDSKKFERLKFLAFVENVKNLLKNNKKRHNSIVFSKKNCRPWFGRRTRDFWFSCSSRLSPGLTRTRARWPRRAESALQIQVKNFPTMFQLSLILAT